MYYCSTEICYQNRFHQCILPNTAGKPIDEILWFSHSFVRRACLHRVCNGHAQFWDFLRRINVPCSNASEDPSMWDSPWMEIIHRCKQGTRSLSAWVFPINCGAWYSNSWLPVSLDLHKHFCNAQEALPSHKSITLPQPSDQLWIVPKHGLGATLYVSRNNKLLFAGFFSAKLRKH